MDFDFGSLQQWFDELFTSATTQTTFIVIGIVASILLVISLILDGIFDWLNFGDGPLSLTTIGAFGALFGWVGYAAYGFGAPAQVAALIGAGVGLAGGIGAFFLSKFFQNSTSSATFAATELVSETAVVIRSIPDGDSSGEVALTRNGQRVTMRAKAAGAIPVGRKVQIIESLSPTSVLVEDIPAPSTAGGVVA
jgi:hypothetical protein